MISSFFMSREQIANPKFNDPLDKNQDLDKPKKVNINVLLSKIKADNKKTQLESSVFFGLIAAVIITAGVIASL